MEEEAEGHSARSELESWAAALALKPYLHAISDPTRLTMLRELARTGERPVLDLARILGLSQPLTSWHLRILRQAGLVSTRRAGRQILCHLDYRRLGEWQAQLDAFMRVEPASSDRAKEQ